MPQPSYEYALGRIGVLSTHLLSAAQIRRIAEASSTKEAMKLLLETGYGENAAAEQETTTGDIDLLVRSQLQLTRKRVQELTPDAALTGLFLLPVDTHNLKVLLKARLLGTPADAILQEGGNFSLDLLKDMVQTKYYEDLPPVYRKAMDEIEGSMAWEADPFRLSARLDKALFEEAEKVLEEKQENGFICSYFSLWADFQNTISLIRAQNLNWERPQLSQVLVPCGDIPPQVFEECLDVPAEQLGGRLNRGSHGSELLQAINEFAQTGELVVLPKQMKDLLEGIIRRARWDTHSLGPVVAFLLARETEAEALRMIFGALEGHFEPQLPGIYA